MVTASSVALDADDGPSELATTTTTRGTNAAGGGGGGATRINNDDDNNNNDKKKTKKKACRSQSMISRNRRSHILGLLQTAASKAVEEEDPWLKHNLQAIPAERIVRHMYDPQTQTWSTDETIVKIESEPFTHGAMRFCYRMKKMATPPKSSTNHRFYRHGWSRASNYVAKAYMCEKDGKAVVDTTAEAKDAVRNDILLQYESLKWATQYNKVESVPAKIHFIRAYAVEFPNRPGSPWFAVERYISGSDRYGAGFVKHNTNAGFVDEELRRVTPQVFSAYTFYASHGNRLVADIQGVGDLYTDPQVLSSDYRFGDGDLGPRGMALFFKSFRHCGVSDAMGMPIFKLSRNELKVQAKYDDDEETMSSDGCCSKSHASNDMLDKFQRLDFNRMRRKSSLVFPRSILGGAAAMEDLLLASADDDDEASRRPTLRHSNIAPSRRDISASFRNSLRMTKSMKKSVLPRLRRTKSDVDEVEKCLQRALQDSHFSFNRTETGELRERKFRNQGNFHKSNNIRAVSAPMIPTEETKINLGKVHYQLAMLHGMGRFPDVVPEQPHEENTIDEEQPHHDSFSVLFHLSHAASLNNVPACLAMGRVQAGLDTIVSDLIKQIIPTDFERAKEILARAMASPQSSPVAPKVASGCLLYQILHDEASLETAGSSSSNEAHIMQVLEDTLKLFDMMESENTELEQHKKTVQRGSTTYLKGDRIEANYYMEGTYYPGDVVEVSDDGEQVTVQYDDDGSTETHGKEHVRLLVPPTATQTNLGGPLSDDEAFGITSDESDAQLVFTHYELEAELAELKAKLGNRELAASLYEDASQRAMKDGKMKDAAAWSLKAAELLE